MMYAGMIGKDTLIRMKMNSKPEAMLVLDNVHLHIGGIIFPELDQADFTGPFEVLSRIPNSTFHILAKSKQPVRDAKGLVLTPDRVLDDSPQLDLLLVPGGAGVNALMEDE